MRLPRNLSGDELARRMGGLGYGLVRQTGSHMRLTTNAPREHHITIPRHDQLRVGTLASIITDVAAHLEIGRDDPAAFQLSCVNSALRSLRLLLQRPHSAFIGPIATTSSPLVHHQTG